MQARPSSLAEVAVRADSLERFGRELADWLHTLRALGSRPALALLASQAEGVRPIFVAGFNRLHAQILIFFSRASSPTMSCLRVRRIFSTPG